MKFFGLILLLVVATCHGASHVGRAERSVIDSGLANLVEQVREMMKNGDEDLGIPVLEPLEMDTLDFDIDNNSAKLAGTLTDLKVDGLSGFTADTLTFSIIGVQFSYCFNWASVNATSKYTVDGTIISVIPVFGTGDFTVKLTDLNVCGTLALSVSGGYLYVRTSTVAMTLGGFHLDISGLLDNEDLSALAAAVVNEMVPMLLVDFESQINTAVNEIIITVGNEVLGTMTLAELLALIRG